MSVAVPLNFLQLQEAVAAVENRACGHRQRGHRRIEPAELADRLMKEYQIFTVAINRPGVRGLRITPNVYTTPEELDAYVHAMKELSA